MTPNTVRLTMAQALVRYLCNQFTVVDGDRVPLFPGVFAIFGHGNVTCLSEALEAVQDKLPTWRGQTQLPDRIRVTVRNSATGQVLTVSGAVIPHITAPAECARANNPTTCVTARSRPQQAEKKEEQQL